MVTGRTVKWLRATSRRIGPVSRHISACAWRQGVSLCPPPESISLIYLTSICPFLPNGLYYVPLKCSELKKEEDDVALQEGSRGPKQDVARSQDDLLDSTADISYHLYERNPSPCPVLSNAERINSGILGDLT